MAKANLGRGPSFFKSLESIGGKFTTKTTLFWVGIRFSKGLPRTRNLKLSYGEAEAEKLSFVKWQISTFPSFAEHNDEVEDLQVERRRGHNEL